MNLLLSATRVGRCVVTCCAVVTLAWMGHSTTAASADRSIPIVRDGVPRAQVVVAGQPPRKTALAAVELQHYIEKISGAKLSIVSQPDPNVPVNIYVGSSDHTRRLNVSDKGLKHGAFRITSGDNWIAVMGPEENYQPIEPYARTRGTRKQVGSKWAAIAGDAFASPHYNLYKNHYDSVGVWIGDGAGPLNGVYELLRGLGVRWYMQGEIGEVVPEAKDVSLPAIDRVYQPDFKVRHVSFFHDHLGVSRDEALWRLRLGLDAGHDTLGVTQRSHGSKFVHSRPEMAEKYPEMFAIWRGERVLDHKGIGAPCLSSETFFEKHLQYARAVFDHYDEPMISLDVVDGYAYMCECDDCAPKGTPERNWNGAMSDYVWGYINRLATELYKSHPDHMVSGLSYGSYALPPEKIDTMSPNIAVVMTQTRNRLDNDHDRATREALREAWLEKLPSKQVVLHEYYLTNSPGRPYAGIPVYFPGLIAKDLRSLEGISMGDMIEVYDHRDPADFDWHAQATNHLNLYITSRLWWDVDADVDELLDEYYEKFYGPARVEMKAFVEYCEANWRAMRNDLERVDQAFALLDQAVEAAGEGVYGERVDLITQYVKPMHQLRDQLSKGRDDSVHVRAVERSADDIVVDGKLDESVWQTVRSYQLREMETGRNPRRQTQVYVTWAGDSLYLAIRCDDPDISRLSVEPLGDDNPNTFNRDNIDILLETQVHTYYQIVVSPTGDVMDLDRTEGRGLGAGSQWHANATVATAIGEDFWSVEIRLPAAGDDAAQINPVVGIAGHQPSRTYPWYLNVLRQSLDESGSELSTLVPTGGKRYHDLAKLAKLYVK